MPKTRTRRNRSTKQHRVTKLELVRQWSVAGLIDELDDLMRACDRTSTWDASDDAARTMNHSACAAVVAHLRRHDVPAMLAKLAGGTMMIIPDDQPGAPVGDDTGSAAPAPLTESDAGCTCPERPVRHLTGCAEILPAIGETARRLLDQPIGWGQPATCRHEGATVMPSGATWCVSCQTWVGELEDYDPLVWVAHTRAGVPFHSLRADGMTTCARSTRTGETMALSTATAAERPACARCFPVVLVDETEAAAELPTRAPGASLPAAVTDGAPTIQEPPTDVVERVGRGLRAIPATGGVLAAVAAAVQSSTMTDPRTHADCPACRRPTRVTTRGRLYAHGPRHGCPGSGVSLRALDARAEAPMGPVEVTDVRP